MLCGGSIGLQADTVTLVSERSIALQGNTVPQVRGNAPQIPCFTMPLEFPAPPSLQILAIARYRCGLRLVWHENPSLSFVPSRMKHYTSRSLNSIRYEISVKHRESSLPLFDYANELICGVDEAGRGPLAGPVFAAAVILNPQRPIDGLRDSKKLTEARRDRLAVEIKAHA